MTRAIKVKNTEDIQKINQIVTRYGFDIWQEWYGRCKVPAWHVLAVPERAPAASG